MMEYEPGKIPVSEIFYSIDGEGSRTGLPVIFIRLFGCNLNCTYCDTRYACREDVADDLGIIGYDNMEFSRILYNIERFEPCRRITLTGGEPLIHRNANELIAFLRERRYEVNIETNGSIALRDVVLYQNERPGTDYFFTMDWKSFSSGEAGRMLPDNLDVLRSSDVIKFVVGNQADLEQMKEIVLKIQNVPAQIYVSPVWGKIEPKEIVEYILKEGLVDVRVQVQLHKIIWDPNMRGV